MADINDARNIRGHYQNQLDKLDEAVEESVIPTEDYEAIKAYQTYKKRRVGSLGTITTYLSKLRVSSMRAEKPLVEFTSTTDVDALIDAHEAAGCKSAKGLNNHLSAIRGLFKWLEATPEHGNDEYRFRHFIENVQPSEQNPGTEPADPDFVISESELSRIRQAAKYPVVAALAEFLGDVGARVTLACQLKRGQIEIPETGTGGSFRPNPDGMSHKNVPDERFRIHDSTGHLRLYLNRHHPDDHPDAPLFPKLDYKPSDRENGAFNSKTAGYHLKKAAERAGIDPDRAHPHNFRKLAITRMKVKHNMSWEAIQLRTGTSDNSLEDIKKAYRRLTEADKHKIVDRELGYDEEDTETDAEPVTVECPACTREYTPDGPEARICPYCGVDKDSGPMVPLADADSFMFDALRGMVDMQESFIRSRGEDPEQFEEFREMKSRLVELGFETGQLEWVDEEDLTDEQLAQIEADG